MKSPTKKKINKKKPIRTAKGPSIKFSETIWLMVCGTKSTGYGVTISPHHDPKQCVPFQRVFAKYLEKQGIPVDDPVEAPLFVCFRTAPAYMPFVESPNSTFTFLNDLMSAAIEDYKKTVDAMPKDDTSSNPTQ
jgi:hypothetical protein